MNDRDDDNNNRQTHFFVKKSFPRSWKGGPRSGTLVTAVFFSHYRALTYLLTTVEYYFHYNHNYVTACLLTQKKMPLLKVLLLPPQLRNVEISVNAHDAHSQQTH